MKAVFFTLGCKVNQYETEVIRNLLNEKNIFTAEKNEKADIVIINSCTVTAESDRKTRQLVRRCRKKYPHSIIALTGCMVQAFPNEAQKLSEAVIICGNTDPAVLVKKIEDFISFNKRIIDVKPHEPQEKYCTPPANDFPERTRAYMKIEDGCDRFCTYCIIPTARGRVRSRSPEEITPEAKILANKGFCEIVLVGINLSAYGKNENFNLCDAVDAVCKIEGIKRVRLGSLEPDHITDEMLLRLKNQEKFCPQFHLSLQSGCNETLKRMNRHYTADFYEDLCYRIRNTFNDSSITTDIMVGFAGETEEEFSQSLEFAKKIGFAKAHVFMYSRRSGTIAAALPTQVNNEEKQRRSKIMIEACTLSEQNHIRSHINKELAVLFETLEDGYFEGYTPDYTRVRVKSDAPLSGLIKKVRIISAEQDYCIGEIV